jgi:formylglycine-generating enzyme required for sulfatase activity/mono/diheme cytochrome c family protein
MNSRSISSLTLLVSLSGIAAEPVDFERQVKPVLESACVSCHRPDKANSGYRMDERESLVRGGEKGVGVVPGDPQKSPVYSLTVLPKDHDDIMPPKGEVLSKWQTDVLAGWIKEGAKWPAGVKVEQKTRVSFEKDIKPIFEFNCVGCHREGHDKGGLRMDNQADTFRGGDNGKGVLPFDAKASSVFTSTALPEEDEGLMPPKNKGGPLPKEKIELIRTWIEQGAVWPAGLALEPKKLEEQTGDEKAVAAEIHKRIQEKLDVKTEAEMKNYSVTIPGTSVGFEMIAIRGGEFTIGSPAGEKNRGSDEGPQFKVKVEPFWMGKCEVTWNEYELFMYPDDTSKQIGEKADKLIDGVSRPTKPYVEMSFGMGKDGYPAISMTQHAANKYCEWLSAKTGHLYRLPTEAEWEYACRAGTTTAYSFGDDPAALKDHAWFANNSNFKYQKVGKKTANAWGLHDMHGNVMEWCLDQYNPDYSALQGALAGSGFVPSAKPYPHVARGGSWDDDPEKLRSAARRASGPEWKIQDPQLPKSIWYHTDAQFLGFRLVRPLKVPAAEQVFKYWNNGVEKD